MEDLGEILRRLAIRNTSGDRPPLPDVEEGDACDRCGGRGWLTLEAAVGDPNFGRTVACVCRQDDREEEAYSRLLKYSNLGSLARFTFETVEPEGGDRLAGSRDSYQRAYQAARDFAEAPEGWLVILGPHGSGKTILAAAAANRCIDRGHVVFFSHVPDLLDHLRATFSPASDIAYSELFEQVKSTPILVLDGLGSHSTTPWAEEKLGQIINHRYNAALPTVVTSAASLDALDPYVSTRLRSPGLSRVVEIEPEQAQSQSLVGRIDPEMLERMTFETFDVRGNNPNADQRLTLEHAFQAASSFSDSPQGWLILTGETGVGKTHLAVAIAGAQMERGNSVIFAFVPDLMDHLRRTFDPESPVRYDLLFEEVRTSPLLILDDFGKERKSDWAVEKLYQIIVHRHNLRLPTIITSTMKFEDNRDPILSRVLDESLSSPNPIDAPDYRKRMGDSISRRRKS